MSFKVYHGVSAQGTYETGVAAEAALDEIAAVLRGMGQVVTSEDLEIVEDLDDDAHEIEDAKAYLRTRLRSAAAARLDAEREVVAATDRIAEIERTIAALTAEKADIESRLPSMRVERDRALDVIGRSERRIGGKIEHLESVEAAAAALRYGRPVTRARRAKRDGRILVDDRDLPTHAAAAVEYE